MKRHATRAHNAYFRQVDGVWTLVPIAAEELELAQAKVTIAVARAVDRPRLRAELLAPLEAAAAARRAAIAEPEPDPPAPNGPGVVNVEPERGPVRRINATVPDDADSLPDIDFDTDLSDFPELDVDMEHGADSPPRPAPQPQPSNLGATAAPPVSADFPGAAAASPAPIQEEAEEVSSPFFPADLSLRIIAEFVIAHPTLSAFDCASALISRRRPRPATELQLNHIKLVVATVATAEQLLADEASGAASAASAVGADAAQIVTAALARVLQGSMRPRH
jgi:hypothetical protein